MSESRKTPRKPSKTWLERPFAPDVLERAREIAGRYQIVIEHEDGRYFGHGLELPFAMDDGKTPDECVRRTREALVLSVATILEAGESPPAPASQGTRTEQVNIRLTPQEKARMAELARQRGFSRLSDYLRTAALTGG